jgi:hypothetical protein
MAEAHLGGDDGRASAPGPGEILIRVQARGLIHVDPALSTGAVSQRFARGALPICLDAAGMVIATGDRATRFAVGDEVFGHFFADSWAWVEGPCGRTAADGPHVELRPEGLEPLAAAALAHNGLTAKTILRAADLRPGQTALVIGATCRTGAILLSLLAEAGAHIIDSATDAVKYTTGDPVVEAFTAHPDLNLLVDLVSFGEPYFISAARHAAIVSARPRLDGPGVPRIGISAEPGDLAALAQRALDGRQPVDIAPIHPLEGSASHRQRPAA